jgi:hypothetical protein
MSLLTGTGLKIPVRLNTLNERNKVANYEGRGGYIEGYIFIEELFHTSNYNQTDLIHY